VEALLRRLERTHYSEITFTGCVITEAALAFLAKWTPMQRRNFGMTLAHRSHYAILDTVRLKNCAGMAIGDLDEPENVEWTPGRCVVGTFELDGETGLDGNTLENVAKHFVVGNHNLRELVLYCTEGATVTTTTVLQKLLLDMNACVEDGEQRKLSLDVYAGTFEVADILKRVIGHRNCFIDILKLQCSYNFTQHLHTVMEGIGENGGSLCELDVWGGKMLPSDLHTLLHGLLETRRVQLEYLRLPIIVPWNHDGNLKEKLASFLRQQTKLTDIVLPSMGMDSFQLCKRIDEDMFLLEERLDTDPPKKKFPETFTKTEFILERTINYWAETQNEKGDASSAEQLAADVLTGIFHLVQSASGLADILAASKVDRRPIHDNPKKRRKTVNSSHVG
jgi:hypothetical protein